MIDIGLKSRPFGHKSGTSGFHSFSGHRENFQGTSGQVFGTSGQVFGIIGTKSRDNLESLKKFTRSSRLGCHCTILFN